MAAVEIIEETWVERTDPRSHLRIVTTTPSPLRTGPSLAHRREIRARMLRRRRRTLLVLAMIASVVILSWPGHAFGGTTGSGLPTDLATSSVLASGMDYVVQPGDTLSSIATMVNPLNPDFARRQLTHELGSSVVVVGEHVLIP